MVTCWMGLSVIYFPLRLLLPFYPSWMSFLGLFAAALLAPWKKVVEGSIWFLPDVTLSHFRVGLWVCLQQFSEPPFLGKDGCRDCCKSSGTIET